MVMTAMPMMPRKMPRFSMFSRTDSCGIVLAVKTV